MKEQSVITFSNGYVELDQYFLDSHTKKILLVCGDSIEYLEISKYFYNLEQRLGIEVIRFSSFKPNPQYASVVEGVEKFHIEKCDTIVAVGGGSAMDVAKCIKLYSNMDVSKNYLEQKIKPNNVPFYAMPTTAGTGSESTRFAVIYYEGVKQSISHYSCIPSVVILDASVLRTLPLYQKKSTMMDALCHAVESFWSVNATDKSKEYSKEAIRLIFRNKDSYLINEDTGNKGMMIAANCAGKAINITQTTAGHAMCYKLTSLYGIPHGHAAALCVSKLWPYMISNTQKCCDKRGKEYLDFMFKELAGILGYKTSMGMAEMFQALVNELKLEIPLLKSYQDYEELKMSVNPVRMGNNPILLDIDTIDILYHQILEENR